MRFSHQAPGCIGAQRLSHNWARGGWRCITDGVSPWHPHVRRWCLLISGWTECNCFPGWQWQMVVWGIHSSEWWDRLEHLDCQKQVLSESCEGVASQLEASQACKEHQAGGLWAASGASVCVSWDGRGGLGTVQVLASLSSDTRAPGHKL